MKFSVCTVVSLTLLLGGCSRAADAPPPVGKPAGTGAVNNPVAAAPPAATPAAEPVKSAVATGTVNAVDTKAVLIMVTHGPVESLGWSGMMMPFKATPEQIASVKVGQKVRVEFEARGMNGTITKITPEK